MTSGVYDAVQSTAHAVAEANGATPIAAGAVAVSFTVQAFPAVRQPLGEYPGAAARTR